MPNEQPLPKAQPITLKPTAPSSGGLRLNLETPTYPYAETINGSFTGKLLAVSLAGYTFVGKMTLAEFQRRAGKRAFVG